MIKFVQFSVIPKSNDIALLLLRLTFGGYMLYFHGLAKLLGWSKMSAGFPDPLGIGSTASFGFTIGAELVMALLVLLGLFTRFASLALVFTMGVAFFMVHGGKLSGDGSGEMAVLYALAFLVTLVAGAGRYSIDRKLGDT
jgi:putative oxidoreductase